MVTMGTASRWELARESAQGDLSPPRATAPVSITLVGEAMGRTSNVAGRDWCAWGLDACELLRTVGVEDVHDIRADLERALDVVATAAASVRHAV